jgi:serine/threonine protein kinase
MRCSLSIAFDMELICEPTLAINSVVLSNGLQVAPRDHAHELIAPLMMICCTAVRKDVLKMWPQPEFALTPPPPRACSFAFFLSCATCRFPQFTPSNWSKVIPSASPDAIDLITKLTFWDPARRLSSEQALQHPYFAVSRARGC